jgi:hypothetical protein
MKVTAIIPDELVKETQSLSNAKTITEAMIIALNADHLTFQVEKNLLSINFSYTV